MLYMESMQLSLILTQTLVHNPHSFVSPHKLMRLKLNQQGKEALDATISRSWSATHEKLDLGLEGWYSLDSLDQPKTLIWIFQCEFSTFNIILSGALDSEAPII